VKSLAALTEEKAISVKLFGKVKIYLADQSKFEVPDEEALRTLEEMCQKKAQELKIAILKKAEAMDQRIQLESTPTDSSLKLSIQVRSLLMVSLYSNSTHLYSLTLWFNSVVKSCNFLTA
jgi:hypothetical protein